MFLRRRNQRDRRPRGALCWKTKMPFKEEEDGSILPNAANSLSKVSVGSWALV